MVKPTYDPGANVVAQNLADADKMEGMPKAGKHSTEVAGAEHHAAPTALGLNGGAWVSLAMLVFFIIVVAKGGLKAITGGLDKQIADIRRQLDEAKTLRAEAEALRNEYDRKIADAEKTAGEMVAHAEAEAAVIVDKAKTDAAELVERRGKMAEDKIAAAERAALADVRAKAADAAAKAAGMLIEQRLGADKDKALVDRTIAGLGRLN